jgi:hypothetical protein
VSRENLTFDAYFQKLGKRKLDQMDFDSSLAIFGIVTTGSSWHFIHWTGSVENPKVEVSKQYLCDFTGDMQSAKDVVSYIVHILQTKDNELKNTSKRPCTEKSKDVPIQFFLFPRSNRLYVIEIRQIINLT